MNFNCTASVQMMWFLRICFSRAPVTFLIIPWARAAELSTQIPPVSYMPFDLFIWEEEKEEKQLLHHESTLKFSSVESFMLLPPAVQHRPLASTGGFFLTSLIHFPPLFANTYGCFTFP